MNELPKGLIFEIARASGMEFVVRSGKAQSHCPFHEDRRPSAFLSEGNVFGCSVCTPGGGMGAKKFCEARGLRWEDFLSRELSPQTRAKTSASKQPPFEPENATQTWALARSGARDDGAVEADRDVYRYLEKRGLGGAWDEAGFGVLHDRADLHPALWHYCKRGYRIVSPLYSADGTVVNIQARGLDGCDPKTLVPFGSRISGTVFADNRGVRVLQGIAPESSTLIYGEGLTDLLALTIASPFPVLTSPGTSNARAGVGIWATGRRVLLALDNDKAGQAAVGPVGTALHQFGARSVMRVVWPQRAKDACDALQLLGTDGLLNFLSGIVAEAGT